MQWYRCVSVMAAFVLAVTAGTTRAGLIDMVTVGNPGNAADSTGYGAVDYVYQIGKYEVTASQYTAFLNAVAATDTYGLYQTGMSDAYGAGIQRSGSSGSYAYSVADGWANRPVNYVNWGDAARFTNWLHNGQPTGTQGAGTTETSAYTLNGAISDSALMNVMRNADAKHWIPTENEWYKAAYHKNDGATGNYFDYPTSSDSVPSNDLLSPDPGNSANFYQSGYTIGSPYWTTEVGEFENSASPYGTFDQGGNLWEWNEAAVTDGSRGLRGGSWLNDSLLASSRNNISPMGEGYDIGFRVASSAAVPEPGSITLCLSAALAGLLWRRRWR